MVCKANSKGFLDESCEHCFAGYSVDVPQVPGSKKCKPHPDTNPFCLSTRMVDGVMMKDQCDICEKGKYLKGLTRKCEQYTLTAIENCFNYFGYNPDTPIPACRICGGGKAPVNAVPARRVLEGFGFDCTKNSPVENCEYTMVEIG